MCKKHISLFLVLLTVLLVLFSGCGEKKETTSGKTIDTVGDVKFYRIQFPGGEADDVYHNENLIEEMFEMDKSERTIPYGIAIQDFTTNNGSTLSVSGFNIAGCNKSVAYAAYNARDYFIFFDGKIDSSNSQQFLMLMLSKDSMPYSDGEKYIKKYLKNN
ncbi:MAG: hypothetical protein ACI4HO_02005 [Ruminococcus sp.]